MTDLKKFYKESLLIRNLNTDIKAYILELVDKQAATVMLESHLILKGLKVNHWFSAGTALGFYREGYFIPHDTDIDVEVELDWNTNNKKLYINICKDFNSNGYTLHREVSYDERCMQMAFIKDGVIIDIYFMYSGVEEEFLVNITECGYYKLDKKFIQSPIFIKTLVGDFPFPFPVDDYLKYRYGNWKSPRTEKTSWVEDCKCITKIRWEDE